MKRFLLFFFCLGLPIIMEAQVKEASPNPKLLEKKWKALWISPTEGSMYDYGIHHFRKKINLSSKPESFIINVSGDQRYQLFVNGKMACIGPSRGDASYWYFETVDIAPLLTIGENILAATVWHFGEWTPGAQISIHTGFIVQGNSSKEEIANTNSSWKVYTNRSYSPNTQHRQDVGPGENIDGSLYPWNWNTLSFDDSKWRNAKEIRNGQPFGYGTEYTWALVPRDIPFMEESDIHLASIRKNSGANISESFLQGDKPFSIPANSKVTILFDQGYLTTAYPELSVSYGKGSSVKLTYAEALSNNYEKGNRNDIEGKSMVGYCDIFSTDGGIDRLFRPLWFRTYRYLEMEISTGSEPLTINSLSGKYTGYPFKENGSFSSDDPVLSQIWEVGWRTARLCANETYYDCPYYEQLQYIGDTRIQALISLYVSGDDRLVRKAIQTFNWSRSPEGITKSRYPARYDQFIPPFSLYWINMVHDYWMHRNDNEFVRSMLPGIKTTLSWFADKIDTETGMLGFIPHWNFCDWPEEWPWSNEQPTGGVPPGGLTGGSALISLQMAYTLKDAIELFNAFGEKAEAAKYETLRKSICKSVWKNCYDEHRGLIVDDLNRTSFSQHTNIMGILSDAIPVKQQKEIFERIVADKSLIQATFYYRFYLYRAMKKVGLADNYVNMLDGWKEMLNLGLSTFAEKPEPTRSDCHAWSASPNYDFLATVCGIEPAAPGFKEIRVAPHPGYLKHIEGIVPHPNGNIEVNFDHESGQISGKIILPKGTSGHFEFNGKKIVLKEGINCISKK